MGYGIEVGEILYSSIGRFIPVRATLTDTQVKALPTTGIQLLAAPGAGLMIYPGEMWVEVNLTAGYTNISDQATLTWQINGLGPGQVLADDASAGLTTFSDMLASAGRRFQKVNSNYEDILTQWGTLSYALNTASYENQALNIKITNSGGNLTGGNAANSMRITMMTLVMGTI